ncbi:hypothetical protein HJG43_03485 [Kineosporiaceae bacterium SCSIO 59966]|nr:hypothetical protein HJG43_03485 [Kineosporiaceae bacterium SCSIO 59966]
MTDDGTGVGGTLRDGADGAGGPSDPTWRWAASASAEELATAVRTLPDTAPVALDLAAEPPGPWDDEAAGLGSPAPAVTATRRGSGDADGDPDGDLVVLDDATGAVVAQLTGDAPTRAQLAALRGVRHLRLPLAATRGPVEYARVLQALALAGVPAVTGPLPLVVRRLVGADLADVVAGTHVGHTADPLTRRDVAVRARRAALLRQVRQPPAVRVVVTGDAVLVRQSWPSGWAPPDVVRVDRPASHDLVPRHHDVVVHAGGDLCYGPFHVLDAALELTVGPADVVGVRPTLVHLPGLDVWVRRPPDGTGPGVRSPSWAVRRDVDPDVVAALVRGDEVDGRLLHDLGVVGVAAPAERDDLLRVAAAQWARTPAAFRDWGADLPWSPGRAATARSWFDVGC